MPQTQDAAQFLEAFLAIVERLDYPFFGVVVSQSFSPQQQWLQMALRHHPQWAGCPLVVVAPGQCNPWVATTQYQAGQLGADRVANLVAARQRWPHTPLCVADFGTALTVDALSADGQFLGGAIVPGWETVRQSLGYPIAAFSPLLECLQPTGNFASPPAWNTGASLQFGLSTFFWGGVSHTLAQVQALFPAGVMPHTVVTGGLLENDHARPVLNALFQSAVASLTLEGLVQLATVYKSSHG